MEGGQVLAGDLPHHPGTGKAHGGVRFGRPNVQQRRPRGEHPAGRRVARRIEPVALPDGILAALAGAAFLVGADTLSRTLAGANELPIGIVTALIGVPSLPA